MTGTDKLREAAAQHEARAQEAQKEARKCFIQGEKAEQAGKAQAALVWRAKAESQLTVASSQRGEADRLRMMADVYDELPDAP